jgi:hypothetical protein
MAEPSRTTRSGGMSWVVIGVVAIVALVVLLLVFYDRQPEVPSTAQQPGTEQPATPAPQAPTNPAPERPPNSTQ